MKFEEVQALLDKGFTAEFIMNMVNNTNIAEPEVKPEEQKTEAKTDIVDSGKSATNENEAINNRMTALENAIDKLVTGLQANAIINSNQPAQPPVVPIETQIGELIAPSQKPNR